MSNALKKAKIAEDGIIPDASFNLSAYAKQYAGKSKVERLIFIAEKCPSLQRDAFRMAVEEAKKGSDVELYMRATTSAQKLLGNEMEEYLLFDTKWAETIKRQV